MKHVLRGILFFSAVLIIAQAAFNKHAETDAFQLLQTGETKAWCPVCGMNLTMFAKTNHALIDEDGTAHQYCSIRCLAVDMPTHEHIKAVQVIDVPSETFIPVADAHYVIGSEVPGTMTRISKLAFESKWAARKFSKNQGGETIVNFDEALALSREHFMADNAMLSKKRQGMVYPKAKMLYNKLQMDTVRFPYTSSIPELKAFIKSQDQFSSLNENQLQMLSLYIWDVVLKESAMGGDGTSMVVPDHAKCPVCGMFVYKYPHWAASIQLKDKTLYFDGVKDAMKFIMDPKTYGCSQDPQSATFMVTDYYHLKAIDGKQALYVIGSDILGPMGHELIPFETQADADVFLADHAGMTILSYSAIDATVIEDLDR